MWDAYLRQRYWEDIYTNVMKDLILCAFFKFIIHIYLGTMLEIKGFQSYIIGYELLSKDLIFLDFGSLTFSGEMLLSGC